VRSFFHNLGGKIAALIHPFGVIARELTLLRELYELELSARTPPIRRITESPSSKDTEVFYGVEEEKRTESTLIDPADKFDEWEIYDETANF